MKQIFFGLVLLFAAFKGNAAVRTWDGGGADTNWGTAANWVGDVAPVVNDDLVFPASAAQFTTNNNFSGAVFNSVTFEGGNYTVNGTSTFLRALNVNAGTQTLNTAISPSGATVFTAGPGVVVPIVLSSLGSGGLTIDGEGSFGLVMFGGTGPITKNGLGASLLASTILNYSGAITVNNGIFVVDASIPNSSVTISAPITGGGELGFSGFGGTGTVGTVNVTQGTISAGTLDSPTGILNTHSLNFTSNGNYAVKIGGLGAGANGHDQLNVTGTVSLNNARLAPIPWNNFRPSIGNSFTILSNDSTDAVGGTFLNLPEGAIFAGALNTAFRITYAGGDGNDIVITRVNRANFDFDGDGSSEISAFRPSNATWNAILTSNGAPFSAQWGLSSDKIAPADYDGDNKTDTAIFRDGVWWILNSFSNTVTAVQFGLSGDIPIPNDFDGDGRADLGVFRPSAGIWYQLRSLGSQTYIQQFGQNGDQPLMGDFDGDGMGDIAVYRPSTGDWHLWMSATGSYVAFPFGIATDKPCAADFDGDGKTDPCVYRATDDPNQPDFYILKSSDSGLLGLSWGVSGDLPMLGDYDGDGKTDIGIFRAVSHDWYWLRSSTGSLGFSNFGNTGDLSIPSAYVP
jgi:hypothetical protein